MTDAVRDRDPVPSPAPSAAAGSAAARVPQAAQQAADPLTAESAGSEPRPGWRRLDERYVTLRRIGGWIRVAVWAVIWALASLIALVAGAPLGVWLGVSGLGLFVLLQAIFAHAWPRLSWQRTSYRVSVDGLEIRRGVWWRTMTTVPRSRVQHTDVSQGPLERSFGLGTLVLYTAGTDHSRVGLPGLAYEEASAVRDRLAAFDDDDAL